MGKFRRALVVEHHVFGRGTIVGEVGDLLDPRRRRAARRAAPVDGTVAGDGREPGDRAGAADFKLRGLVPDRHEHVLQHLFGRALVPQDAERHSIQLGGRASVKRRQRDAIRTAFFDGLTYAELAARDAVPLGTMKSWVRRGLARLKDCLDG